MKLIVGLGNPGEEFKLTRHNIGYMVVDNYLKDKKLKLRNSVEEEYNIFDMFNEKVLILKPKRYMNLSGEVIKKIINYYKIKREDILIISDDVNLSFGMIRLRNSGSSGGHNGLKNIELNLKTQDYKRLRIGISNNHQIEMKDYVLGKFTNGEQKKLNETLKITNQILDDFIKKSFTYLMCTYNKR